MYEGFSVENAFAVFEDKTHFVYCGRMSKTDFFSSFFDFRLRLGKFNPELDKQFTEYCVSRGIIFKTVKTQIDSFLSICEEKNRKKSKSKSKKTKTTRTGAFIEPEKKLGGYDPVAQKRVFDLVADKQGSVNASMLAEHERIYLNGALTSYNFYHGK